MALASLPATAMELVRVPGDAPDLTAAVQRVADGGVIEFAPGVYQAPARGWTIRARTKAFTVRASVAGTVELTGGGTGPVLRFEGGGPAGDRGGLVRLEGLTVSAGRSTSPITAGGITIDGRLVVLSQCVLRDHAVDANTGGGALYLRNDAHLTVEGCAILGNRSTTRGGAAEVVDSTLVSVASEWRDNRTNVPPFGPRSVGGAIWGVRSTIEVDRSEFRENQAAFAGGAIYLFGNFDLGGSASRTFGSQDVEMPPASLLKVRRSVFADNRAIDDEACCPQPEPATGGAIFVENDVILEILESWFERNLANWGGAISSYRTSLSVERSVFRGNRATLDDLHLAIGGTLMHVGNDIADASTDFGAVDRPTGSVLLRDSLFIGPGGGSANALTSGPQAGGDALSDVPSDGGGNELAGASQGGCLFLGGDLSWRYGDAGLPGGASLETTRLPVVMERVTLQGCTTRKDRRGFSLGGGLFAQLVDLEASDVWFLGTHAIDGVGGGMTLFSESRAVLRRPVFADTSSGRFGGAVNAAGSRLEVSDGWFFRNRDFSGAASALYLAPSSGSQAHMTGFVRRSTFSEQTGIVVFEADGDSGFFNRVTYADNVFQKERAVDKVWSNPLAGGGLTVQELNQAKVNHGGKSFEKVTSANRRRAGVPSLGALRLGPVTPEFVELAYVWSGQQASIEGQPLTMGSGLFRPTERGTHELQVDGEVLGSAEVDAGVPPSCSNSLCLDDERFLVTLTWRDFDGNTGEGRPVPFQSDDSGLLWFFEEENWELLIKVLDVCFLNDHFWVFLAATTTVEFDIEVLDQHRGTRVSYFNPLGVPADAVTDTKALPCSSASAGTETTRVLSSLRDGGGGSRGERASVDSAGAGCGGEGALCLQSGRIGVAVEWFDGTSAGDGTVVPVTGAAASDQSGLFWFFEPENWEMLVKVLDGCLINGHYWVLAAATTNVQFDLVVTDLDRGRSATYRNPLNRAASAIADTSALPCDL